MPPSDSPKSTEIAQNDDILTIESGVGGLSQHLKKRFDFSAKDALKAALIVGRHNKNTIDSIDSIHPGDTFKLPSDLKQQVTNDTRPWNEVVREWKEGLWKGEKSARAGVATEVMAQRESANSTVREALGRVKKKFGAEFFKDADAKDIAMLTNPWKAWGKYGAFKGESNKDYRVKLQRLWDKDNSLQRLARQEWRYAMTTHVQQQLIQSNRDDKHQIMELVMAEWKVPAHQAKPLTVLNGAADLDPSLGDSAFRESLAERMESSETEGNMEEILDALGAEEHAATINIIVGHKFFEASLFSAQFEYKNAVLSEDGSHIYAQMKNGCEGNLVIINLTSDEVLDDPDNILGGLNDIGDVGVTEGQDDESETVPDKEVSPEEESERKKEIVVPAEDNVKDVDKTITPEEEVIATPKGKDDVVLKEDESLENQDEASRTGDRDPGLRNQDEAVRISKQPNLDGNDVRRAEEQPTNLDGNNVRRAVEQPANLDGNNVRRAVEPLPDLDGNDVRKIIDFLNNYPSIQDIKNDPNLFHLNMTPENVPHKFNDALEKMIQDPRVKNNPEIHIALTHLQAVRAFLHASLKAQRDAQKIIDELKSNGVPSNTKNSQAYVDGKFEEIRENYEHSLMYIDIFSEDSTSSNLLKNSLMLSPYLHSTPKKTLESLKKPRESTIYSRISLDLKDFEEEAVALKANLVTGE